MQRGQRLGRYVLERKLGEGGFAAVWLAERDDGVRVAAKILHGQHFQEARGDGPSGIQRFIEEAHLLARLRIEGVVELLDVVDQREDGIVALILEYLPGGDLPRHLPGLTLEEILEVAAQAADTLAQLHDAGVVHRDVKPSNLFLLPREPGDAPRVKVLDLGVAKDLFLPSLRDRTALGVGVGTLQVMAPETVHRLEGKDVPLTHAADQWGLATTLYACLSGRLPFDGDDYLQGVKDRPIAALALRPELGMPRPPAALEALLARCFEKDPALRFPHMRALGAALRTSIGAVRRMRSAEGRAGPGATVDARSAATEQSARFDRDTLPFTTIGIEPPRRSWAAAWIAVVLVAAAATALGIWWTGALR